VLFFEGEVRVRQAKHCSQERQEINDWSLPLWRRTAEHAAHRPVGRVINFSWITLPTQRTQLAQRRPSTAFPTANLDGFQPPICSIYYRESARRNGYSHVLACWPLARVDAIEGFDELVVLGKAAC